MTLVVRVTRDRPDPSSLARAADCLRRGGLVAFPTETVYGLGVHALNREAVLKLFEAKRRPPDDPLIVHVAEFAAIAPLVAMMPDVAATLAARFWPGPLTLVLPRGGDVPLEVTAGLDTIAVRIPSHPVARALLTAAAIPVAAPSANLFTRPSPTRAAHVLEDLEGRIDMVLDAGGTDVGVESTVLDLTITPPQVLRPGAITLEALQSVLPSVAIASARAPGAPMRSPGLLSTHYAPRAPMTLYQGDAAATRDALADAVRRGIAAGRRVGVIVSAGDLRMLSGLPVFVAEVGPDENAEAMAARLYGALRELDAAEVDLIVAREPPREEGLWRALRDRLRRAAAHVVAVRDQHR
jgi:L-threonylcarbamoyladenylate synthase